MRVVQATLTSTATTDHGKVGGDSMVAYLVYVRHRKTRLLLEFGV